MRLERSRSRSGCSATSASSSGGDPPLIEGELGFEEFLERVEAELLEPPDLALGEGLEGEVGKGRASRERERFLEELELARGLCALGLCEQALEAAEVELLTVDAQDITGRAGDEHVGPEQLAQPHDEVVEGARGGSRRLLSPELLDEAIVRDDLARTDEEKPEERPLLVPTEGERPLRCDDLERPENPEVDAARQARRGRQRRSPPRRAGRPSLPPPGPFRRCSPRSRSGHSPSTSAAVP